ncbi:MAG: hypothetical protein HUK22_01825, partial [Thermoguttaceae bacterium]|nr:hypothetical protein [Thermoguttaceae bacterium]
MEKEAREKGLAPRAAYELISGETKNAVRESLIRDQGGLCAYCMRRIPDERDVAPAVKIEHWVPLSATDSDKIHYYGKEKNYRPELDYENLFAVCSGNQANKNGVRKWTCDTNRGNKRLKINPCDETTIAKIEYRENGVIYSKDDDINKDLNETLNLNCVADGVELPEYRKRAWEEVLRYVEEAQDKASLLELAQELLDAFERETDVKT